MLALALAGTGLIAIVDTPSSRREPSSPNAAVDRNATREPTEAREETATHEGTFEDGDPRMRAEVPSGDSPAAQMRWVQSVDAFRERFEAFMEGPRGWSDDELIDESHELIDDIDALDRGRAFLPGEAYQLKRRVIERSPTSDEEKQQRIAELPPPTEFRRRSAEPTPAMLEEQALVRDRVASGVDPEDIEAELERRYRDLIERSRQ